MRGVFHAVCIGLVAPALLSLPAGPAAAIEPIVESATVGTARTCWLPDKAVNVDYCGDEFMYAGADDQRQSRRSLVDLRLKPGTLPAGVAVLKAELHAFEVGAQSGGQAGQGEYAVYEAGDDWADFSAAPDQQPISSPLLLDASDGWRTWPLDTTVVEGWLAEEGRTSTQLVLRQTGTEKIRQTLGFRSASSRRSRPYLEITYALPLYVAPTGVDTNPATRDQPVRSIQRAVDLARSGQHIQIAPGTYERFSVPSGKSDLTIDGEDEAGVLVDNAEFATGNMVTVWGNGTTLSDLTIQECRPDPDQDRTIESTGSAGIRVEGANQVTIARVTVRGGREELDDDKGRGCYGIMAYDSYGLELSGNDVYDNGAGIYVRGGGYGVIEDNSVHDHTNALIRNTEGGGDDFGAAGIAFDHVLAGRGGYVAERNVLTDNVAASYDYGFDGGGFEIYASSGIVMRDNTLTANDTALETGADTDSDPDVGCSGNTFTGNTVVGYTSDFPKAPYSSQRLARKGLVLRCDEDMLVDSNTFTDIEYGAFTLINGGGVFDAPLDGLQITNNTVTQHGLDHFVTIEADLAGIPGLALSGNTYEASSCDWYFAKFWFVSQDMTDWTKALEQAGVDPAEKDSTFTCS